MEEANKAGRLFDRRLLERVHPGHQRGGPREGEPCGAGQMKTRERGDDGAVQFVVELLIYST